MRICKDHWSLCRKAVEDRGMGSLVSRGGEEAIERMKAELAGARPEETFDPLMSLNAHFSSEAMRCGGLYLMTKNETGDNDGHFCPICEFEKHLDGFDAETSIGEIADQMVTWARGQGLLAAVS